jgi:hypothetical protein
MKRQRFTLSLSPEVVKAAQEAAHAQNKSFSRMVEDGLIAALQNINVVAEKAIVYGSQVVNHNHAPANCAAKKTKRVRK